LPLNTGIGKQILGPIGLALASLLSNPPSQVYFEAYFKIIIFLTWLSLLVLTSIYCAIKKEQVSS
jgi:hypothetical protein